MTLYKYHDHVKVVGILEIIFQVLSSISTLVVIGLAIGGISVFHNVTNGGYLASTAPPAPNVVSGILIAILVVCVLWNIFGAWMVYLVFTGGQQKSPSRLNLWYIISCVMFSLWLLFVLLPVFLLFPWSMKILFLIYGVYRIYSIHVVRRHANELQFNPNFSVQADTP